MIIKQTLSTPAWFGLKAREQTDITHETIICSVAAHRQQHDTDTTGDVWSSRLSTKLVLHVS